MRCLGEKLKAQASLETIFVLALVVMLSILVLGKIFSAQDGFNAKAAARQVIISGMEGMEKKYYLNGIETVKCTGETRIIYNVTPEPPPNDSDFLSLDA